MLLMYRKEPNTVGGPLIWFYRYFNFLWVSNTFFSAAQVHGISYKQGLPLQRWTIILFSLSLSAERNLTLISLSRQREPGTLESEVITTHFYE
jgi:hypothetical protein